MLSPACPAKFAIGSFPFPIRFACSLLLLASAAPTATAQDAAVVDAVAAILATEDARRYDRVVLEQGARHEAPVIRRRAVLAMARIGDRLAVPTLLTLLADPDSTIRQDAAFALGQLADPAAVARLRELVLATPTPDHTQLHAEAVSALVRIGGSDAANILSELMTRSGTAGSASPLAPSLTRARREAWRLHSHAPIAILTQMAQSALPTVRHAAVYSLARLRHPQSLPVLVRATDDPDPAIRALAARALVKRTADSAGQDPRDLAERVRRLVDDPDPTVRIQALRALATYESPQFGRTAQDATADANLHVRLQALATVGVLGGPDAARVAREYTQAGPFALRYRALLSLAQLDGREGRERALTWVRDPAWFRRAAAAEALGLAGGDTALLWLERLVEDPDGRVAAQAFAVLRQADATRASSLARAMLVHPDPVVRTFAAEHLASDPNRSDVDRLVDAYGRARDDTIPDARMAAVAALGSIAAEGLAARVAVQEALFGRFPRSDDYLVRRVAAEAIPDAESRWGPVAPMATGREIGDYREIARRLVLPAARGEPLPTVTVETERGRLVIELFAHEAPMTVNAILRLVDRRFYDGLTVHRLVPGFVLQTGDPRGDGWGGPGFTLRDEVSRRPYERATVGMALFGPDTGGSQFFVTLVEQPHLERTYPVVGRVVDGVDVLERILPGDRIRTVRRGR